MKTKFGIKEVVAIGIGTALFVALTEVQIPLGFIPNTALQPRAALLAFMAAVFGPAVGGAIGITIRNEYQAYLNGQPNYDTTQMLVGDLAGVLTEETVAE